MQGLIVILRKSLLAGLLAALAGVVSVASAAGDDRPRVVITADPELDDNNTLIRAVLYSSEFRIEGLVYASSQFHWQGDGKGTTQYLPTGQYTRFGLCPCTSWRFSRTERFIDDVVSAYERVYPNLRIHDRRYPAPAQLRSRIRWGNVAFEGDFSADTPGSDLIKSLLLDSQPGPLYVTAQGGESTIARALKSIYEQYSKSRDWKRIQEKVSRKLIIVPAGDQDGTWKSYIEPNWPDVEQVQFASAIDFGYLARRGASPRTLEFLSSDWTQRNVSSRGPLGSLYRVWGDGKEMVPGDPSEYFKYAGLTTAQLTDMGYMVWAPPQPKGSFLSEGDTGTFINFVGNGLAAWRHPGWGGWGGVRRADVALGFSVGPERSRKLPADTNGVAHGLAPAGSTANAPAVVPTEAERRKQFESTFLAAINRPVAPRDPRVVELSDRFFSAAQNDFAARLAWSVTSRYQGANHPPTVRIKGSHERTVAAGASVSIEAVVSDPDHDAVTARWWQYREAGTYKGEVAFSPDDGSRTMVSVPADAAGQTIHAILEVTDGGTPALTRYERVVLTVH